MAYCEVRSKTKRKKIKFFTKEIILKNWSWRFALKLIFFSVYNLLEDFLVLRRKENFNKQKIHRILKQLNIILQGFKADFSKLFGFLRFRILFIYADILARDLP